MVSRQFSALLVLILHGACGGSELELSSDDMGSEPAASVDTIDPALNETPPTDDATAAASVVRQYYDAIASEDYRRAYLLWGDSGRLSGQSFDQFRDGFGTTAAVEVDVFEPGRVEGAAGSRYVAIPVGIEALTMSGDTQRFAGTYTLRRSVVDGATDEQMQWHIYAAEIDPCPPCDPVLDGATGEIIHLFGERLRMVSVLGPPNEVSRAIRQQYADIVTPELLQQWLANPGSAPGREVSSPWPRRIEIDTLKNGGEESRTITGNIIYVTSADTLRTVDEVPVTIELSRAGDGSWRISGVAS